MSSAIETVDQDKKPLFNGQWDSETSIEPDRRGLNRSALIVKDQNAVYVSEMDIGADLFANMRRESVQSTR